MKPSTSVSVGVALLATTAHAFVQAPARCVMSGRTQSTRAHARSSRVLPRSRTLVSTMFAGEEPVGEGAAVEGEVAAEGEVAVVAATEAVETEEAEPKTEAEIARAAKLAEIERLRSQEKFITAPTGDYECLQCSFVYKPNAEGQGALPGTQFENLPSTWVCPVCRAPKDTFVAQTKTIAGFEENYQYGFGGNTMTGSQKNLLIFGSLAAFFVLFLAGYALE